MSVSHIVADQKTAAADQKMAANPLDDLTADELAARLGGRCVTQHATTVLKWACALGHLFRRKMSDVRHGYWCLRCDEDSSIPAELVLGIDGAKSCEGRGPELIIPADDTKDPFEGPSLCHMRCAAGHMRTVSPVNFRGGRDNCPACGLNADPGKAADEIGAATGLIRVLAAVTATYLSPDHLMLLNYTRCQTFFGGRTLGNLRLYAEDQARVVLGALARQDPDSIQLLKYYGGITNSADHVLGMVCRARVPWGALAPTVLELFGVAAVYLCMGCGLWLSEANRSTGRYQTYCRAVHNTHTSACVVSRYSLKQMVCYRSDISLAAK